MRKAYKLLINDNWEIADLTANEAQDISNELKGKVVVNRQYDIRLRNGETVDLGIIDGIKPTVQ